MNASERTDGGPAFPVLYGQTNGLDGMTLRDWFAGQCICAYMTWSLDQPQEENDTGKTAAARYAKVSYQIADAMLAARAIPSPADERRQP